MTAPTITSTTIGAGYVAWFIDYGTGDLVGYPVIGLVGERAAVLGRSGGLLVADDPRTATAVDGEFVAVVPAGRVDPPRVARGTSAAVDGARLRADQERRRRTPDTPGPGRPTSPGRVEPVEPVREEGPQ